MSQPDLPREPSIVAPTDDCAVSAAVARLGAEFGGRIRPGRIARAVTVACRELAGSPRPALPELVERLARERLRQEMESTGPGARGRCAEARWRSAPGRARTAPTS